MTLSDWLGGASIFCWLWAQSPQIYVNWRRGSIDAVSPAFLWIWFGGDALNLMGCVLTDQLPFQTYLATYFCLIDLILLAQLIYYTRYRPGHPHKHFRGRYRDASVAPPPHVDHAEYTSWLSRSLPSSALPSALPSAGPTPDLMSSFYSERNFRASSLDAVRETQANHAHDRSRNIVAEAALRASRSPSIPKRSGTVLLLGVFAFLSLGGIDMDAESVASAAMWLPTPPKAPLEIDWQRLIGRTASWTCATLYLASRLPQVWHNYRHKSVEGLSSLLFCATFMGNSLYALSILLSPVLKTDPTYLPESIPFLIGSAGTLSFDLAILFQIVIYRRRRARKLQSRRERALRRRTTDDADESAPLANSMSEDEEHDGLPRPSRSRSIKRIATITEESLSANATPT